MKLAFLISSLDGGGAAKIVSNITTHLPMDWQIDIILNDASTIAFPYRGEIISLGIQSGANRAGVPYQARVFLRRLRILKKLKKERGYDCCISYMDSANVANILTACKGCKTILNVVNNVSAQMRFSKTYRYIVGPLIRIFYNRSDGIIALSNEVKRDLIRNFGIRQELLVVSYCSVDLARIDQIISGDIDEAEKEWFDHCHTVVTAGRLVPQKGQWHLIRAFREVIKEIPEARLVIFGDGILRDYLESLITDCGLRKHIKLMGFSPRLDAYIAKSAVFCFPSVYEGFGTALQEALACGVACVAADYESGAREQLSPDYIGRVSGYHEGTYGILTEPCSLQTLLADMPIEACERGMADAIIHLLQDEEHRVRMATVARERGRDFDIHEIARQWIADIERMVS